MEPEPELSQVRVAAGNTVPSRSIDIALLAVKFAMASTKNGSGSVVFSDMSLSTSWSLSAHAYMSADVSFNVKSTDKSEFIDKAVTSNDFVTKPILVLFNKTVSPAFNIKPLGLHG